MPSIVTALSFDIMGPLHIFINIKQKKLVAVYSKIMFFAATEARPIKWDRHYHEFGRLAIRLAFRKRRLGNKDSKMDIR